MTSPSARQEIGKRTVLPDPKAIKYLGAQTQAGHDLLRLLVLLMREQIRQRNFAMYGEINWTRVADYINERVKFPDDMGIRRGRNSRTQVISHDILHEIDNKQVRERSIDILETIAIVTTNPLTDEPFTVYDLLAVTRGEYERFKELELAVKDELGLNKKRGGAILLGQVIARARDDEGWTQAVLAKRLSDLAVLRVYTADEIKAIENPQDDAAAPDLALLQYIQKLQFIRSPDTGKPYRGDGNELALIFLGKLDPDTGKPVIG